MDLSGVFKLTPQLFEAVLADDEKASRVLAADLKAAWFAPQTVRFWTPFNARNSGGL